jgi:hypothetical protein
MATIKMRLINFFSVAAIAGNILFILWVTFNGINEHFHGTFFQKLSYVGLMGLLLLNTLLVLRGRKAG